MELYHFGNINSSRIIGKGTVNLHNKSIWAGNVLLVEDMKYNLLSASQTCDKGNIMIFYSKQCQIRDQQTKELVGTTTRTPSNIYVLDEVIDECHIGKEDECWLWHKISGHIKLDSLVKLIRKMQ